MPDETASKKEAKTKGSFAPETLLTVLKILAGSAVLFFVLGFAIVQTYLAEHKLEGMVWLSHEFYVRAGGRFLLDVIKSPFFGAPVFFPLVAVLYWSLVPRRSNIKRNLKLGQLLMPKQRIKLTVLGSLLVLVIVFELITGSILNGVLSGVVTNRIFNVPGSGSAHASLTVAFFCITMPVIITGGFFISALYGEMPEDEPDIWRLAYHFVAVLFACALVYLPISYGQHIYDWRVTPILYAGLSQESDDLLDTPVDHSSTDERELYLLGEFNNKYVFVRTSEQGPEGIVETIVSSQLHRLVFDVQYDLRLSELIDSTRSEYREAGRDALREELSLGED